MTKNSDVFDVLTSLNFDHPGAAVLTEDELAPFKAVRDLGKFRGNDAVEEFARTMLPILAHITRAHHDIAARVAEQTKLLADQADLVQRLEAELSRHENRTS